MTETLGMIKPELAADLAKSEGCEDSGRYPLRAGPWRCWGLRSTWPRRRSRSRTLHVQLLRLRPRPPLHGPYHDHEYGFPQRDDAVLFERLVLEINQAGLSWETMLRKREGFRRAYDGFDVDKVAGYGDADRTRLLEDAGIIRNRLKVDAAIHNAQVIQGLRQSHGSFAQWLDAHTSDGGAVATRPPGSSCSRRPSASPAARSPANS